MTLPADQSWVSRMETAVAASAARCAPFGCRVSVHLDVTSTNDLAMRQAADGAPEGTVVIAARQRKGRGRRGATFHSPPDTGLYLSTILRPAAWPSAASDSVGVVGAITLMAGVAAVDTVHAMGARRAEVKWPNDVVVPHAASGGWRKLAGVLTEASTDVTGHLQVVLGIGINVRGVPPGVALDDVATSLADEGRPTVTLEEVAVALLAALARARDLLAHRGRAAVVDAWRRHAPSLAGRPVSWVDGDVRRTGVARGVDETGALAVDTPAGALLLVAGDVRWETSGG